VTELPANIVRGVGPACGSGSEVAGVGEAGNLAERARSAAGDDQGRTRSLERRLDVGFADAVVGASEVEGLGPPDPADDGDRLLERLLSVPGRRVGEAHPVELVGAEAVVGGVPADAQPEDRAAVRQVVEVGSEASGQERRPIGHRGDHLAEADPLGRVGDDAKVQPDIRGPGGVVAEEEVVVAVAVGELAGMDQLATRVRLVRLHDRLQRDPDPVAP
jgi:hypothetical protein